MNMSNGKPMEEEPVVKQELVKQEPGIKQESFEENADVKLEMCT